MEWLFQLIEAALLRWLLGGAVRIVHDDVRRVQVRAGQETARQWNDEHPLIVREGWQ